MLEWDNIVGVSFLCMGENLIRLIEITHTILLISIKFSRLRISVASMKSQIYRDIKYYSTDKFENNLWRIINTSREIFGAS